MNAHRGRIVRRTRSSQKRIEEKVFAICLSYMRSLHFYVMTYASSADIFDPKQLQLRKVLDNILSTAIWFSDSVQFIKKMYMNKTRDRHILLLDNILHTSIHLPFYMSSSVQHVYQAFPQVPRVHCRLCQRSFPLLLLFCKRAPQLSSGNKDT